MFAKTYPIIVRALLPGIDNKKGDARVRGRIKESDLPRVAEHEEIEKSSGHMPGVELMEIVKDDGSVYYEAVTSPNCFHKCPACRGEINDEAKEFGTGAIGVFADSSGGELERLRKEMRALASTFTDGIKNMQGGLPPAIGAQPLGLADADWSCVTCGAESFTPGDTLPPEAITQDMRDDNPDLCAGCIAKKVAAEA